MSIRLWFEGYFMEVRDFAKNMFWIPEIVPWKQGLNFLTTTSYSQFGIVHISHVGAIHDKGQYFGQKRPPPPGGLWKKFTLPKKQGRNSAEDGKEIPKNLPVFT